MGRTNRSKVQVKGNQDRFGIPEGLSKTRLTYFAAVTGGTCNLDVSIGRYIFEQTHAPRLAFFGKSAMNIHEATRCFHVIISNSIASGYSFGSSRKRIAWTPRPMFG